MSDFRPIFLATRGSPLALAQAHTVLGLCRAIAPAEAFELKIIKTTGDKLQRASMAQPAPNLPKGLFTKELETALLGGEADLAVHSLKDLPTDLPDGLGLGAVLEREDPRDVMVVRESALAAWPEPADARLLQSLPHGAGVATSSTRRKEQLLACRPDLAVSEIRGNVGTRLQKLADQPGLTATMLALAGLRRLGYRLSADGLLSAPAGQSIPAGLKAAPLSLDAMLPCVGQAAIGIEIRAGDARLEAICRGLNHTPTWVCVTAERAFLQAMGGGCQSPVAAHARLVDGQLQLAGVSFRNGPARRAAVSGLPEEAVAVGRELARALA